MALPVRLQQLSLDRVPSFTHYLPYLAYDEEEHLYLLTKDLGLSTLAWGCAFECLPHPGPGDSQATLLKGLFELPWPPGSTIQISALGLLTETLPLLRQYVSIREPGIYRDLARARVDTLYQLLLDGKRTIQTAPLRDLTLLVSATVPIFPRHSWWDTPLRLGLNFFQQRPMSEHQTITTAIPSVSRLRASLEQLLLQAKIAPHTLTPDRLLTLLFPILNPGHAYTPFSSWDRDREIRRQLMMADTAILPNEESVILDGHIYRSITPLQYPAEMTTARMISMVGDIHSASQQIPTPFMLTLNAVAYDRADIAKKLQRKHTIISQQAFGPMARIIPRLSMKKQHYDIAGEAIENGHVPVSAYLHLALWTQDPHQADQAIGACESLWRGRNFLPQRDGPATLNLLRESLPMALSTNPRYLELDTARARTMLSSNVATMSPIAGDWKGTGRPVVMLISRRGQPCGLDLFHNPHGNFNAIIAGKSGGGKSFFTNDLLLGLLGANAQVWIIDKGRSYEKLVQTLKGDYLVFNANEPICLNPFSSIEPQDFEDALPALKAIVAQMASPSRRLDDYEASVIGQVIQDAYAASGHHTTITQIADGLFTRPDARCQDLAQMLHPYTAKGEYARFFEGPATINLMRSRLLLLELEELSSKPNLQSVVFLALVLAVKQAMQSGDMATQKLVAIDEAWQFLRSAQAAEFVVEIYRRARKYNMAILTITQEITDLFGTEAGASILANSDMRILFPHKQESIRDPRVGLNDYELTLMRSLTKISHKYSEMYITHPTGSGVYRHIVDPQSYWLYTTDADEVATIRTLVNHKGFTVEEAIRQLAGVSEQDVKGAAPPLPAFLTSSTEETHT